MSWLHEIVRRANPAQKRLRFRHVVRIGSGPDNGRDVRSHLFGISRMDRCSFGKSVPQDADLLEMQDVSAKIFSKPGKGVKRRRIYQGILFVEGPRNINS